MTRCCVVDHMPCVLSARRPVCVGLCVSTYACLQPAVGGIVYDADGKGATVQLVPRAPYGTGTLPAIESFFYTTDHSWPQIGAPSTVVQPTKFIPPNVLSNDTIRITRTTALNVRYKFRGLLESMTMTLVVPVPVQPTRY